MKGRRSACRVCVERCHNATPQLSRSRVLPFNAAAIRSISSAQNFAEPQSRNIEQSSQQKVDQDRIQDLLNVLERRLHITHPDDWYSVKLLDIKEIARLPNGFSKKDLAEALSKRYPQHTWDMVRFLSGRQARQKLLERVLKSIFPTEGLKLNARKEAGLLNEASGSFLELDIYFPALRVAFEYQDPHHYISAGYTNEPLETWKSRDKLKHELAASQGITIIPIPCWWDGKQDSLVATIKQLQPHLLQDTPAKGDPIPEEPPANFFDAKKFNVPGVGEPPLASFLKSSTNPLGWWLFEKYDGIRGFWNPKERVFYSRHGNVLRMPPEIINEMPDSMMLDGEIWFGRDNYSEVVKVSQRVDSRKIDWSKFRYMVYDIPDHKGTYRERYTALVKQFGSMALHKFIQVAPYVECEGKTHLENVFLDIIENKGEGIILRLPNASHKGGRTSDYLKFKTYKDAEAKVIACPAPQMWECLLPNGTTFIAGPATNAFSRKWNPKEGDIVTFLHQGFFSGNGSPIRPAVYRPRPEYTWEDVVKAWEQDERNIKEKRYYLLKRLQGSDRKEKGHWTTPKNIRTFFDTFAQGKGFDPLKAENWLKISTRQIKAIKGGKSLLRHYNDSLTAALEDVYSEITFVKKQKATEKKPRNYWNEQRNVRAFLEDFARERGFDPLVLDNWAEVTKKQLIEKKGGVTLVLGRYKGSHANMIKEAFPELSIPMGFFRERRPKNYWKDATRCRAFFDYVAKQIGFDPSLPENWYHAPLKQILSQEGASGLLKYYKNDWQAALKSAYPELVFPSLEEERQKLPLLRQ